MVRCNLSTETGSGSQAEVSECLKRKTEGIFKSISDDKDQALGGRDNEMGFHRPPAGSPTISARTRFCLETNFAIHEYNSEEVLAAILFRWFVQKVPAYMAASPFMWIFHLLP